MEFEYTTLKKIDADIKSLKAELEAAKKENATAKLVIVKLKTELSNKEPLFLIGVAVRIGFLEGVKRTWVNGVMKIVRGDPSADVMKAKNDGVHHGNYPADLSLFTLGILTTEEARSDFSYVYGIARGMVIKFPRRVEALNLRGTMVACFFKTPYTHDRAVDLQFEKLELDFKKLGAEYCKTNGGEEAVKLIGQCAKMGAKLELMRKIVATTSYKERQRVNGH